MSYTWIERSRDLEAFAADFPRVIALDLEADSLYRYRERICLIQISFPGCDAVIDALALPDLHPLKAPLEDGSVEKVIHGADYDIRLLRSLAGIGVSNLFDTMIAARLLGAPKVGLSDLLLARFGIRTEKRFQRADWGVRPLPREMIQYAVLDTRHLLALRDELKRELESQNRLSWAQEEFEALCRLEPAPRAGPDACRIRGASGLGPRQRAVLQALLEWRENEARRRDLPPFKILDSRILVSLAESPPSSVREMRGVAGITEKVARQWGDGLLRALQNGISSPPKTCSRRREGSAGIRPGARKRLLELRAVRDAFARELRLDPGVLCSRATLMSLARVYPEQLEARLKETLRKWQLALMGEEFRRILLKQPPLPRSSFR